MNRTHRRTPAAQGGQTREWYTIRNADTKDEPTEVLIYDEIGSSWWGGVSAKSFAKDLSAIDATDITVRLNSPGGDVFEGIAILNALRNHKARITVYVDGIAASAASFIAMAGDEIVMCRNAEMMIHDAWGYCGGNAAEVRKYADELDRVSDNIASIYADRTDATTEEWRAVMRDEVWYSADEAVTAGLADRVEAKKKDSDKDNASASFDLSIFNYAGRRAAPAPKPLAVQASTSAPAPAGAVNSTEEGGSDVAFTDEQVGELREALGLPEGTEDQDVFDAVLEKLTAPEAEPNTSAKLPAGVVAVDAATLDALRRDAQRGAQARAQQETDARQALVSAAIKDGRIESFRKDHWLDALKADPEGSAATLASLAPGRVPVEELGHSVGTENAAQDLGWFGTDSKGA
ncbi:head maturation protease, ClpP-related [Prescottella equi]|uniref:head maturation protease, ClpP-related n=1 Tax=Rhodococcus hoagii TaxID=43767 RepID=UPI001EEC9D86|nr:head maturation protease, ClpP-related [Prescottella equi]